MTDQNAESLLFRRKYRIPATRLPTWDYASPAHYFVTICTDDRFPWFGNVHNQRMCVNDIGGIVDACWRDIPNHYDHVTVNEFMIMPDHVHGIIVINPKSDNVETPYQVSNVNEINGRVETPHGASLQRPDHWKPGSLGQIINQFKSACAKIIRRHGHPDFGWQSRYYDQIMTDADRIARVREYIKNNPVNYGQDEWWRI